MAVVFNDSVDKKAQRDILELQEKIALFQSGEMDSEKFRGFRLARGVYGQRQLGVQMIRIKLPFGQLSPEQMIRIADLSDEYASSNLHATTRQDIQIHYVKLAKAPELWTKLEEKGITLKEACGNTVRNITASAVAGIDPDEPFDVSPYAYAMFKYFLRNPICQELGRKIKIAFSSSEKDSAYTFIHDLGFIPKVRTVNGVEERGFRVVFAGGLGAQPFLANLTEEFLPEDQLMPYTEATLRVFDRYGERVRRHKARMKYLVSDLGLEEVLKLIKEERLALKSKSFKVDIHDYPAVAIPEAQDFPEVTVRDEAAYTKWFETNVFEQKQKGFYAVQIKVTIGDMKSDLARGFAHVAEKYAAKDIRVTVNQGYMLKYVRPNALKPLYNELLALDLARPGFDSIHDITACPGTDTCNLGIASSYGLSEELERVLSEEYSDLVYNNDIKIKISGCMNACGQHTVANIGFHGMSLKAGELVLPAMQVLLGGGIAGDGAGLLAEKVIKLATKRIPDALRYILNDYEENSEEGEYFNTYFRRQGKNYFYQLLKPLSVIEEITQDFLTDWGNTEQYETAVGVGECAGALIDLVGLLISETNDKLAKANEALAEGIFADSIYHSYSVFINSAKALLLTKDVACNTQTGILNDFDKHFVETGEFSVEGGFRNKVLEINKNEPTEAFAIAYKAEATAFLAAVTAIRSKQLA